MILKLALLRKYSKIYKKNLLFQIFVFFFRSGQGAFGRKEKAEETRWARRYVRISKKLKINHNLF
jgi:hypothetical protein